MRPMPTPDPAWQERFPHVLPHVPERRADEGQILVSAGRCELLRCRPDPGPAGRRDQRLRRSAAAQAALGAEVSSLFEPRTDGDRNALRILLDARRRMGRQRSADRLALTMVVRTTELGVDGREALTDAQIRAIAAWRARPRASRSDRLARDKALGAVTSAVVLVAHSRHGRIRSETAFAAIAGVKPIQASSGNTVRHWLNRNGDRQLNKALHTIARTRMPFDATTKDYVARRTMEGKAPR